MNITSFLIYINYIFLLIFVIRASNLKKDAFIWYLLGTFAITLILPPNAGIIDFINNIKAFWLAIAISLIGLASFIFMKKNKPVKLSRVYLITYIILFTLLFYFFTSMIGITSVMIPLAFLALSFTALLMLTQGHIIGFLLAAICWLEAALYSAYSLDGNFSTMATIEILFNVISSIIFIRAYLKYRKQVIV